MSLTGPGTGGLNPSVVSFGLVSGANTASIIQAELQPFEIPINNLQSEKSTLSSNVGDYQQINSDLLALKTSTDLLSTSSGWNARSATTSDSTIASATAGAGTPAGSLQFTVTQLATANSLVSAGTASSTSQVITNQSDLLLSMGADQLGFSSLAGASNVTLGSHAFS